MGATLSPEKGRPPPAGDSLHRAKIAWAKAHGGSALPSNVDYLNSLSPDERARLSGRVYRKPSRTLSGVAVVAVMTAPAPCPHGQCSYCPGGVAMGSPQSYTGEEPSALRGAEFHWDSERITRHRLESLEAIGHPTSKVEAIVMGGTFPARPRPYIESVFRGIYDGLNGRRSATLAEAQERNETADRRLVGLTVETRPDWCDERILPTLLDAGVTRVEIGVECLRPEVLERTGRAHGVDDVARATRAARSRGLKVAYHLMLGLPGATPTTDLEDFLRITRDPAFVPDMLKIYPTLVVPMTRLHAEWARGEYTPYDTETAVALLAEMKRRIPPWIRIQRIQRDIPSRNLAAGVRASNLRELVRDRLQSMGQYCRCLRCREAGRRANPPLSEFVLVRQGYRSAGGVELLLSWEAPEEDVVAGFLRLRMPDTGAPNPLPAPVIRELKVLGAEVPIGQAGMGPSDYQHRGLGRRLVEAAEEECRDRGFDRLYVLSAVGTRRYYAALGFERADPHMVKSLFAGRNPS
jgi:elongator complex protein 3